MRLLLSLVVIIPFVLAGNVAINGQQRVLTWTSSDGLFSTRPPLLLNPDSQSPSSADRVFASRKVYSNGSNKVAYFLWDLELTDEGAKLSFAEKTEGLELLVAGDYDDHDYDRTIVQRKINGFDVRDVTYKNKNSRAVIIDTGHRIFVLGVISKKRSDVTSRVTKTFFSSFRKL